MKRSISILILVLVSACAPTEQVPKETPPQVEQGDVFEKDALAVETPTITERLLPSGFIEIGDRNAPVTLLVFTEHYCRYCKEFYFEQFPKLYEEFITPGKVKLHIGILPLRKYEFSENALRTLLCAATQEKGIPMHELLFTLGAKDRETMLSEAVTVGLDTTVFSECIDSPDTLRTIERQKSFARSLDVTLVPTFFINGEKSVGLPQYADLRGMIEEKLE